MFTEVHILTKLWQNESILQLNIDLVYMNVSEDVLLKFFQKKINFDELN